MEQLNILFVDDELHNLNAFKSAFRRDYIVHLADSASKAMEILAAESIQIIITDQRMPDVTGVEFLKKITPQYAHTLRMVLSGFSDSETITQAIKDKTVHHFINKPWDKQIIKSIIAKAFAN
ncbi:MAG TPA: two-component system response regulator [Microscillaceae bacterium]|nr:two-component system response regulator [Microscillaceae bacterium]